MKTLKLFNAVVAKPTKSKRVVVEAGYVIEPAAAWAQSTIQEFYRKEALAGRDLNQTFHKSWATIKNSTRGELAVQQILHYLSTYGTDFTGDIYIPDEVLNVPGLKVVFKTIRAYTKEELTKKALGLLQSGVALKEETVDDLLTVLVKELDYTFTGKEGIRNKEAVVKIADLYGVIPDDFMGFFRYILFRTTNSALIIKDGKTIAAIKASTYNPELQFVKFGVERLAEHFNRFKPLFLAFKKKCPKVINEISRLSKTKHKPMVQNPLNAVTSRALVLADVHWLDNATPYALFKALNALHLRMQGQTVFAYKVRNGKSYVKEGAGNFIRKNYTTLLRYLQARINLKGVKIYTPEDVQYAIPTSEKMYVGNIPMGTKFYGEKLAVGVYWKNDGGARDIDLSGLAAVGKVGWNSSYGRGGDGSGLMYSGDITNAPEGAVEYLYAQNGCPGPTLVFANIFSGEPEGVAYKIIVGRGDKINHSFMLDPNNLFMEASVKGVQVQDILGLFATAGDKRQSFTLVHVGAGHARVSGYNESATLARVAFNQEWRDPLNFEEMVTELGAKIVDSPEKADLDLSLDKLEKDSFIKLFEPGFKPKPKAKKKVAA